VNIIIPLVVMLVFLVVWALCCPPIPPARRQATWGSAPWVRLHTGPSSHVDGTGRAVDLTGDGAWTILPSASVLEGTITHAYLFTKAEGGMKVAEFDIDWNDGDPIITLVEDDDAIQE
jgi:hypothetical protein